MLAKISIIYPSLQPSKRQSVRSIHYGEALTSNEVIEHLEEQKTQKKNKQLIKRGSAV